MLIYNYLKQILTHVALTNLQSDFRKGVPHTFDPLVKNSDIHFFALKEPLKRLAQTYDLSKLIAQINMRRTELKNVKTLVIKTLILIEIIADNYLWPFGVGQLVYARLKQGRDKSLARVSLQKFQSQSQSEVLTTQYDSQYDTIK